MARIAVAQRVWRHQQRLAAAWRFDIISGNKRIVAGGAA
jgi:hypothetical protein